MRVLCTLLSNTLSLGLRTAKRSRPGEIKQKERNTMAVVLTDYGFKSEPILSVNPTIPDNKYKPNKVLYEWHFSGQGVGDGSAGGVTCPLDFGNFIPKSHYICITAVYFHCWTAQTFYLSTHSDRWDNLYFPGHTDEELKFYGAYGAAFLMNRDQLRKPLYMGRVRKEDADAGLCDIYLGTNNNGEPYNVTLQGYTLERPLPFTSILQP